MTSSSLPLETDRSHPQDVLTVVIRPAGGFSLPNLAELWRYRHVLFVLVWRNVIRRYRQTLLGPIWFIISPLVRMLLFSLVLGKLAGLPSDGVPYPVFTYTALLPWQLFASGVFRSTSCFVTYQHILSKVYFPRLLVPIAEVVTTLVDFFLSFGILVLLILFYGFALTPRLLILPFLLLVAMCLALSVGLLVATFQARFRDVSKFVGYIMQFWFYGTPVAYSATLVVDRMPSSLLWLYWLNPMNGVVEGFRWALLDTGRPPDLILLASSALISLCLVGGSAIFLRNEHSIVDLV